MHPDYFRGLNYLINEEPDKAVDVFIKLLEVDSDTVEMHLALGNLFRRRGEVDRAIRIHQNIIARPQLNKHFRVQALSALGQDYLSAGVLDRAERLFLELMEKGAETPQSLNFLLHIYQQEKDWAQAIKVARRLEVVDNKTMSVIIAQYYCELAQQYYDKHQLNEAEQYLKKAFNIDPNCVRASMLRARWAMTRQSYKEAFRCLRNIKQQGPDYLSEVVDQMVVCAEKLGEQEKLISYLRDCLHTYPRVSFVVAIANQLRQQYGDHAAINFIAEQIQHQASLRGLSYLVDIYISNSHGDAKEKLEILKNLVDTLLKDKPVYRCSHCGFSGKTLFWLCPSCHSWSTTKPIQGLEGN